MSRRFMLASTAVFGLSAPANAALFSGGIVQQSASALTVTEFNIGYFQTFYSWTNLTISGTAVTDAGNTNQFLANMNGLPFTIAGVAYIVAAFVNSNHITLATAPGNGTGVHATIAYPGTVINRAVGSNSRSVTLSGTYTGNSPSSLDCKLTYAAACQVATPGATFQNWATMSSLSASGGTWTAVINVPLCNDWVVAQIRDHYNNSVLSNLQVNFWGVGVNVMLSGQSNIDKLIELGPSLLNTNQDSRTRVFDHSGWHAVHVYQFPGAPSWAGADGVANDNVIRLSNEIANSLNCVTGVLVFEASGTAIKQWLLAANGGYANNDSRNIWVANAIGGNGGGTSSGDLAGLNSTTLLYSTDFEAAVWQQGENDVGSVVYGTQLAALFGQIQSVNGRSGNQFKFCVVPIGTQVIGPNGYTPGSNSGYDSVREAQQTWISSNVGAGSIYGGSVQDATHNPFDPVSVGDYVHWCYSDRVSMGKRYTQALLQALGAQAYGAAGPAITSASMSTGSSTIIVTVTQDQGTQLLDANGSNTGANLQGFVVVINGSPVAVTNAQITGASQITLTTASPRGAGQTATVSYQNGANPDAIVYGQWTNLSCTHNSLTITDASNLGIFNSVMAGGTIVISAGTNFVPGSYTINTIPDANTCTVTATPCPSANGTAGAAGVSVNGTPDVIYDNFAWAGTLYPDTRGMPLQPTNGAISIP